MDLPADIWDNRALSSDEDLRAALASGRTSLARLQIEQWRRLTSDGQDVDHDETVEGRHCFFRG